MMGVTREPAGILLSLMLLFGVAIQVQAFTPPEVYLPELVATWESQIDVDRNNTGFALSVAFINWPSLFLREMHGHPETFNAWLATLEDHTARHAGEPGRGQWVIRQMHSLAGRWDGVRYRDLTEAIRQAASACIPAKPNRNQ